MPKTQKRRLSQEERVERRRADRGFAREAIERQRRLGGVAGDPPAFPPLQPGQPVPDRDTAAGGDIRGRVPQMAGPWICGEKGREGDPGLRADAALAQGDRALGARRRCFERPRTFFKLGPVFDRAQVAPLPPPAIPVALDPPIRELGGDELAPVLPCLIGLAGEIGCTVEFETMTGEDGYYTPSRRRIAIREGMAVNAQAATLVHELGHALLHAEPPQDTPALGRAAEEMVVESVAFTVCGALGFDTPGSSIPYLAVWAEAAEADTIERTAGLIDGLARRIEAAALPREGEEVQTVRWAAPQLAF